MMKLQLHLNSMQRRIGYYLPMLSLLLTFFYSLSASGETYTLSVGESVTISQTAYNGGYIDNVGLAAFLDSHLSFSKNSDGSATITVNSYFDYTAQVSLVFIERYQSFYNGRYHTRAETYYKNVSVKCRNTKPDSGKKVKKVYLPERVRLFINIKERTYIYPTYEPADAKPNSVSWFVHRGTAIFSYHTVTDGSCWMMGRGIGVGSASVKIDDDWDLSATTIIEVVDPDNLPPTSIFLPSSIEISVGAKSTLTPIQVPENTSTTFTWSSEDESIATVSYGKVFGKKVGKTTIKVKTTNELTATCVVNVVESNGKDDEEDGDQNSNNGIIDGHEYVDLGLSVKWATCNVGASRPEEYGNYYAWGETTTKSSYHWDTYKHCDGSVMNVYDIGSDIKGTQYDAAYVNWGKNWRMPSRAEFGEILTKCTIEDRTQNGVDGYLITGPNGNSMFLPSAGIMKDSNKSGGLNYWSSIGDDYRSLLLLIGTSKYGKVQSQIASQMKAFGTPIRAVTIASSGSITQPKDIIVSPSLKTIKVGETFVVSYTLSPSNATTTVTWSSENPNIASVDQNTGKVVGVSEGTTNIIATTSNGLTAQCSITVSGESNIYVNATNFPDVNFRSSILEQGIRTEEDVRKADRLDVARKEIESLKGIELFTSLETLICSSNKLTSLDVSNNTKLTTISCYGNRIHGANLDAFINSLPNNNTSNKRLIVDNTMYKITEYSSEGLSTSQVAKAKGKGWTPLYWCIMDDEYYEYEGYEGSSIDNTNIAIDATNFPDKNFRNFLLSQYYGNDGILSSDEISNINEISCSGREISDLKGIEFFSSLKELYCPKNQLLSLDVSKNTNLKVLYCWDNQLTSLDLSKNTNLTELVCDCNRFISLDVSKNTSLTEIDCSDNQLTSLDVSKNTSLTKIDCSNNQLTSLDVSKNTYLKELDCYRNKIKGSAMDNLINSLPRVSTNDGKFCVVFNPSSDENVCTKTQVSAAKAKGWISYYYNSGWVEYSGSDDTVIDEKSINIDATNFPDKNFRQYLLEQDFGKDGVITPDEISKITTLNLFNKEINNLKGIDIFSSLEKLYCGSNKLTSLDVTKNIALKELSCENNQLTSLIVSNCTKLTKISCHSNKLTSLDVTKNTKLEDLSCSSNQLSSLDLSKNNSLTYLSCGSNKLTSFDVSKNASLKSLDCWGNQLTLLDVSKNPNLKELNCSSNQLTDLDVSKNTNLTILYCYENQIKGSAMDDLVNCLPRVSSNDGKFYVVGNLNYEGNVCTKTQVAAAKAKGWISYYYNSGWVEYSGSDDTVIDEKSITIDATNFPDKNFRQYLLEQDFGKDGVITPDEISKITTINCYDKGIYNLKGIEFFTSLETLYCNGNELTSLDVTKNTNLAELSCFSNQLKSLDVSKNSSLTKINCGLNQLTSLDVSKNTNLKYLICWKNQLLSLNVTKITNLTTLSCFDNQLTSLDVTKNTNLTTLSCYSNQLKSLDISRNTNLTELDCDYNQLTTLDVTKNTNLTTLSCYSNQLKSLDISKNTKLTELDCGSNQLKSLDISRNTNLTELSCDNNQLTSLDVSNNNNLTVIWCYYNQIKGSAMDNLINGLPRLSSNDGVFRVIYKPDTDGNVCTKTQVAEAKARGWTPYYYVGNKGSEEIWEEYEGCDPNSIDGIMMDELEGAPIYNLNGQRIDKPRKGINIIGGKKVVIK